MPHYYYYFYTFLFNHIYIYLHTKFADSYTLPHWYLVVALHTPEQRQSLAVASHSLSDMASLDASFIIVDEKVLQSLTLPEIKQTMTESKRDEPVGDSTTLRSAPRVDNHQ